LKVTMASPSTNCAAGWGVEDGEAAEASESDATSARSVNQHLGVALDTGHPEALSGRHGPVAGPLAGMRLAASQSGWSSAQSALDFGKS